MTEIKQAVEEQQVENSDSEKKQQGAASPPSRKRAVTKAQAKSLATKSNSSGRRGASISALKENASRAEALEHENVAVQNKRTTHSHIDTTDVSGVILPSDNEEIKEMEPDSPVATGEEEKHRHKKEDHKHHSKDKREHALHNQADPGQVNTADNVNPGKDLETLKKKALKSEKKVNKLKKKVHKAEKKHMKSSKIRALKEKLTKVFSKWQRRKKKLEEADK